MAYSNTLPCTRHHGKRQLPNNTKCSLIFFFIQDFELCFILKYTISNKYKPRMISSMGGGGGKLASLGFGLGGAGGIRGAGGGGRQSTD